MTEYDTTARAILRAADPAIRKAADLGQRFLQLIRQREMLHSIRGWMYGMLSASEGARSRCFAGAQHAMCHYVPSAVVPKNT